MPAGSVRPSLVPAAREKRVVGRRRVTIVVLVMLLVSSSVTAAVMARRLQPALTLPVPTGPFAVGMTDATNVGSTPTQIWYPAMATAGDARAPYRPDQSGGTLRERIVRKLVRTQTLLNAPVAAGRHPLVVYTPGWNGRRGDNTAQAQELASYGFIVVAIDDRAPGPEMDFSTAQTTRETLHLADTKVRAQAAVISRMIDTFTARARIAPPAAIEHHIDLTRIGTLGFSFGGAVAAETAILDARVRSVANLDGWMFGRAARIGVSKPFLFIGTGGPAAGETPAPIAVAAEAYTGNEADFDRANGEQIAAGFKRFGGYYVEIDGTIHESFSDEALLPRFRPTPPGCILSTRAHALIARFLVPFFEQSLTGKPAPALIADAPPGVHLHVFPVPATSHQPHA